MSAPVRVLAIPAAHAYPRHVRSRDPGGAVHYLDDPPVCGAPGRWWPPPALDPAWVAAHHDELDVVHLHFVFDAETPESLDRWCDALDRYGLPLVLTVHDLVNPHFTDQGRHQANLAVLVRRAARLVTLTEGAAREVEQRWGRRPVVLPHPHVAPLSEIGARRRGRGPGFVVGLHLKSLRANVVPVPVLRALVAACEDLDGASVVVDLHEDVLDPAHPRHSAALVAEPDRLRDHDRVRVLPHPRHSDAEL